MREIRFFPQTIDGGRVRAEIGSGLVVRITATVNLRWADFSARDWLETEQGDWLSPSLEIEWEGVRDDTPATITLTVLDMAPPSDHGLTETEACQTVVIEE